ncbi:Uncharacterised protein [Bartonella vinsonii]|uniref:Uncharacterized protein n=1 Tax=Bartonella vinsonii TaxID=33047 RepID=A0A448V3U0_BARVI|nr:Uncharacterised protein [Bartonella vinsonii]
MTFRIAMNGGCCIGYNILVLRTIVESNGSR